jgi:hypothetical protein
MLGFCVLAAMELEHISPPTCSSNSSTRVSRYSRSRYSRQDRADKSLSFSFPVMTHSPATRVSTKQTTSHDFPDPRTLSVAFPTFDPLMRDLEESHVLVSGPSDVAFRM